MIGLYKTGLAYLPLSHMTKAPVISGIKTARYPEVSYGRGTDGPQIRVKAVVEGVGLHE